MNTKTKAFIFDMDGILIDSEPVHIRVKRDTFAHFGLAFDETRFSYYMGRTSNELFGDLIRENGRTDLDLETVVRYKHEHYLELLARGEVAPIEGAVDLIRRLHEAGLLLALATSSWERAMDVVLDRFAVRPYFSSVLSGSTLPASKPDPAIYAMSAKRLGVAPADCTVLEDTAAGITAGKRAGMRVIAYRNPNSGVQDLTMADRIVDHMAEIRAEDL